MTAVRHSHIWIKTINGWQQQPEVGDSGVAAHRFEQGRMDGKVLVRLCLETDICPAELEREREAAEESRWLDIPPLRVIGVARDMFRDELRPVYNRPATTEEYAAAAEPPYTYTLYCKACGEQFASHAFRDFLPDLHGAGMLEMGVCLMPLPLTDAQARNLFQRVLRKPNLLSEPLLCRSLIDYLHGVKPGKVMHSKLAGRQIIALGVIRPNTTQPEMAATLNDGSRLTFSYRNATETSAQRDSRLEYHRWREELRGQPPIYPDGTPCSICGITNQRMEADHYPQSFATILAEFKESGETDWPEFHRQRAQYRPLCQYHNSRSQ